jgi:hypothetical protein
VTSFDFRRSDTVGLLAMPESYCSGPEASTSGQPGADR